MNLASIRDTFTRWAPIYDATHAWSLPKRREARLALNTRPGDRVLDLACGTGLNFDHLHELVGERGRVVGVDLTPAMLEIASRRIQAHGWTNIEIREADAACLPFPDASFDKVLCSYALSIIPQYVLALQEVQRVLIPCGRFVSLEMEPTIHSLPAWLQPLPHLCAVDIRHSPAAALRLVFPGVRGRRHWMGMILLAVATKT